MQKLSHGSSQFAIASINDITYKARVTLCRVCVCVLQHL